MLFALVEADRASCLVEADKQVVLVVTLFFSRANMNIPSVHSLGRWGTNPTHYRRS